jgi:hypothetical protein
MSEDLQQSGTQQADPNELTINDLNTIKAIIDLASSRGAFKAGQEMVAVGQTYAKLNAFLEAVAKQAEAQKAAQAGAQSPTSLATGA